MKVLKNVNILPMTENTVLWNRNLWIEEGRIANITARDVLPEKAETVDCGGAYVIPGLIDAHVHLDESYMGDFFLACGITSVRNMRGYAMHAAWRDEILAGTRRGPYIYSTGPIYDGEDPSIPDNSNEILHTPEDVEKAIVYTKSHGFLWLKTYPSILPELYHYLMRRAGEEGLPVCGHMSKLVDDRILADEGYSCCEHSSSLPGKKEDIRYLAASGMWFCPTQAVCETLPDYVWNGKKLSDIREYGLLPDYAREEWEESNRKICESYRVQGVRPDIQVVIDRGKTFFEYSSLWMAGSDCPYPGMIPGFSLLDELEKLVALYGCTPYEALAAATAKPAMYMGISQKKGRVCRGMDADLVILKENPLSDISNIRTVKSVIQGGQLWDKETLQRRLDAAAKLSRVPREKQREL